VRIEDIRQLISEWFAGVGGASLKLPTRWFGRPYDNQHRLTQTSVLAGRLLLELDGTILLILAHPSSATVEENCLRMTGFTHVTLDWDGYGEMAQHRETFDGGVVEFYG
jgi:hypothetical protein